MTKTRRSSSSQRQLRISIIGAGRMGTALGLSLRREGHAIPVVVTRQVSHARHAAKVIRGAVPLTERQFVDPKMTILARTESDILLISTPDDALDGVALNLANFPWPRLATGRTINRVALHTSGAVSSEALAPLRNAGFGVGSMHPLVSVTGAKPTPDLFRGVHFCVEGDQRAVRAARKLIRDLGGHAFTIESELKPLYHAAAAMASGQLTALIDVAIGMLAECGLSKRQARQILLPLLRSTIQNLETKSPAEALTGPLSRRDVSTVRKHLAAMKAKNLGEATALYATLGIRALNLSRSSVATAAATEIIAKLLRN